MHATDPSTVLDRIVFAGPWRRIADALTAFAALVLPSSCVLCGRWDTSLCRACSAAFRRATSRPFRAEAGAESLPDVALGPDGRAGRDDDGTHAYGPLPVVAAGRYGRAVSGVLLAYKNHGHVDLAAPVEAALAGALHEAVAQLRRGRADPAAVHQVLLVPVPGRASSRRRRGYDPLMLLLSRLDRRGDLPAGARLAAGARQVAPVSRLAGTLVRTGIGGVVRGGLAALSGPDGGQKALGRRRRRVNVLQSMREPRDARALLADRDCIIVDDVLTTGATIGEVHRVLRNCGARVLGAVVVAATSSPTGGHPAPPAGPSEAEHGATDPAQALPGDIQEVREWRRVNKRGG
ncbi:ComF family protein [Arthrobacter antioxidans]|uniref:ComF family protein n=1 Tax=Arthrobacter antioxidans TaxID=2895818 RepID=UPI001FFFED43|nr:phosphoribosyltransferase family protein [Arthrobacter antioxidans]